MDWDFDYTHNRRAIFAVHLTHYIHVVSKSCLSGNAHILHACMYSM